jgi:hypothetical protein
MSLRKKDIIIDLEKHTSTVFKYKQWDNGCDLNIALFEDDVEVDLTLYTVEALFKVPDGTVYKKDCTLNGNKITLIIDEEITALSGSVTLEVVVYNVDRYITTPTINFSVEKSIEKDNVTQLAIFTLNELAEMVEDENNEIDGDVEVRLIKDMSIKK